MSNQTLPLTDEQRAVVAADISSRLLVVAGPGTGKTHVLTARIIALLEADNVRAQRDLLILSFSRSAVAEIRRRIRSHDSDAAYARVVTFDSFATALIHDHGDAARLEGTGFDDRIRMAAELLLQSNEAAERVGTYQHVFIDEIQDLVGVRADFVLAMLKRLKGGFTLFGDPAQAIYDWQEDGQKERRSGSFVNRVRSEPDLRLTETQLTVNHRHVGSNSSIAERISNPLRSPTTDPAALHEQMIGMFGELPTLGSIKSCSQTWFLPGMSTALLCRNNGQALVVSSYLKEAAVPHHLQRAATGRLVPAWLSTGLRGINQDLISVTDFAARLPADLSDDPGQLSQLVRRASRSDNRKFLDLPRLAQSIQSNYLPDELYDRQQHSLTVSTVHRAKGLEFDHVVLHALPEFDHADFDKDPSHVLDELRVMYVALTRARRVINTMSLPRNIRLRFDARTGRWLRMQADKRELTSCIEFQARDVHHEDPAGMGLANCDPAAIQDYLTRAVKPGDAVELRVMPELVETTEGPLIYGIYHESTLIGRTSTAFWNDLQRVIKVNSLLRSQVPNKIEGLTVDNVESVAGLSSSGMSIGLGSSGIWAAVRLSGFGKLREFGKL